MRSIDEEAIDTVVEELLDKKKDVIDVVANSTYVVTQKKIQEGVKEFVFEDGKGKLWPNGRELMMFSWRHCLIRRKIKSRTWRRSSQDMVGEGVWLILDLLYYTVVSIIH